jgi:pyruvate, water dikinase
MIAIKAMKQIQTGASQSSAVSKSAAVMSDTAAPAKARFVKKFSEITLTDSPTIGGKIVSLGEMFRGRAPRSMKVSDGFIITADAFRHFLRESRLDARISRLLGRLKTGDLDARHRCGVEIRERILAAPMPADLEQEIVAAYDELCVVTKTSEVAVQSSATAQDLPDASFAGAQQTFLNVEGKSALLEACRCCFAWLFTDHAISYRAEWGFEHEKIALSLAVQPMMATRAAG